MDQAQQSMTKDDRTLMINQKVQTPMGQGHIIGFDPDKTPSGFEVFVKLNSPKEFGSKFWFEFGEVKTLQTSKERQERIAIGAQAFADGLTTRDMPHVQSSPAAEDWLHGWWGAFYKQRDEDIKRITAWLDYNATAIYSEGHCKAIAEIIVCATDYDRTGQIEVRLGTVHCTIPSPATLQGLRS